MSDVSEQFKKLVKYHTYCYFDLCSNGRKIKIAPTSSNPNHNDRWDYFITDEERGLFKKARVLDIGGAEGFYSIKAILSGAREVVMVERSVKCVQACKFMCDFLDIKGITIINQDMIDFVFQGKFDIIFMMRVIHWLSFSKDRGSRELIDSIMGNVSDSLKGICFVNDDHKYMQEFVTQYLYLFDNYQAYGKDFMSIVKFEKGIKE